MTFERAWLVAVALVALVALRSAEIAAQPAGLTMEDARRLVADREALALDLSAVAQLEPDVAGVLAEFPGLLDLSGLAEVGPDVAAALAGCKGLLNLSGVAALTPETAAALARCRGAIDLSGLRSMTPETARALGGYRGRQLRLTFAALGPDFDGSPLKDDLARAAVEWLHADAVGKGLERLTTDELPVVQWLVGTPEWGGDLRRVARLDAEAATVLANFKGERLCLEGLTTLDAATAKALANYDGVLSLGAAAKPFVEKLPLDKDTAPTVAALFDGDLSVLTTLDAATATALAAFAGKGLQFDGLTTLDAATAAALAKYPGDVLSFDGLTTLEPATAKALAVFQGTAIVLDGLTTLDIDTAKAFAEYAGVITGSEDVVNELMAKHPFDRDTAVAYAILSGGVLESVTAFEAPDSVAIAKALAAIKGPLELPNLKKISPKTLSALIEKEDIDIPLIETLELIPEPDGSPTEDFVIPERFQKR